MNTLGPTRAARVGRYPTRRSRVWSLLRTAAIAMLLVGFGWPGGVLAEGVAGVEVIVNQSVTIRSMSKYQLRTLFGMRQPAWPDGQQVRVFVLADDNPLHRQFAKRVLGVFPHQLRRSWNNLVFSGLAQAPTEVANQQQMLERVANTPGAVGYAPAGEGYAQTHVLSVR